MPYNSKQDAVNALRPGWRVSGEAPYMVKVPNPQAGLAGQPAEIEQQQGIVLSIQDPNNPQAPPDTVVIKEVGNNPNTKGGVGFDVIQGPQKAIPATAAKATPAAGLERLDANLQPLPAGSTQAPTFVRDPNAPAGTQPYRVEQSAELGDPSSWTPVYDPNDQSQVNRRVIGYYDPKSQKVAASVPGTGGNKPSDPNNWAPVYRTPGDPKSGVVGQWDPTNNELHAVANVDGKQIVTTQSAIYVVDKDSGKAAKVQDIDKSQPYQMANVDGVPYRFDPNEKDPAKALVKIGPGQTLPKSVTQNGVTFTLNPDTNQYETPPGVPRPTTMTGAGTASKYLITYDATTGEEISRKDNPNYQPQQAQLPTPNAVSPFIPAPDPDNPGGWKWVENKGRVEASDALKQMATQLSGQVVSGSMSVDEAKAIIEAANSQMTAAAQGGSNVLSSITSAANTGAGLLQQRAQTAQNLVGQGLGLLGQTKHGLLVAPGGDFGANLVGGAAGFATDLMGGPDVATAAANLVRRADPNGAMGQDAATAYAAMTQLLQGYRRATGGVPHPIEAAVSGNQGMPAPGAPGAAAPAATPPLATPWQRADQMYGNTPAGNALAAPGAAGTVPPGSPQYLGFQAPQPAPAPVNAVPGQNYGGATAYTGGVAPWNALPQPAFVAPPPAPGLPPQPRQITITM